MSSQKYKIDTILKTKDGRHVGNAIIINHEHDYNVVKTDYGNTMRLTDSEVEELFYIDDTERDFPDLDPHKNSSIFLTFREEKLKLKMQFWMDTWVSVANASNCSSTESCTKYADKALEEFNKRF